MGDATVLRSIVDFKAFERIEKFDGRPEKFQEFRQDFEASSGMVDLDDVPEAALTEDLTRL